MPQTEVRIAGRSVGVGHPCFIIAEIGINHNGDVELAQRLIDAAHTAGCDAVKFQKRTPDLCVPGAEGVAPRDALGVMTYLECASGWSSGRRIAAIDAYCRRLGIPGLPPAGMLPAWSSSSSSTRRSQGGERVADRPYLLTQLKQTGKPLLVSTGMSTLAEVDAPSRCWATTTR